MKQQPEHGKERGGRCQALPLRVWVALALAAMLATGTGGVAAPAFSEPAAPGGEVSEDPREEETPPLPLPRFSEGDLLFIADAAAFPSADSLPRVEFYLRIPNDQLKFEWTGALWVSRVQVELDLYPLRGGAALRWSRESHMAAADSEAAGTAQLRQVLEWDTPLAPGDYVAEVSVTDLQAPKKTLLGMIRRDHRSGTARGLLRVRAFSADSLELSDLEFAESFAAPDSSVFRKPRVTVYPNPARRYGLSGTDLPVFVAGRLPRGRTGEELRVIWEVFDGRTGDRRVLWADTLHAAPNFDRAQVLRLGALPAGRYRLRLTANPATGASRRVEGTFDMAWSQGSLLEVDVRELAEKAELLFQDVELDHFEEMTPGEQEAYWNEYWTRRRAGPEGALGDPLAEFESRLVVAGRSFGGNLRGYFTDRGRVFVKYGHPDEIRQRVMPVGGESLSDLGSDLALGEDSNRGRVLENKGARGRGDTRSYEIWDYDLHGRMIFGTRARQARHGSHMRFIFVDETGTGDYVLKYSSE